MGATIWFFKPASTTWTYVKIYRSSTATGTYTLLATQALTTSDEQSYYDSDGSTSYWYKISFWDGVNESSLSDPVRGGDTEYYASISQVRSRSGLTSADVSASEMADLIVYATNLINEYVIDPRWYWEYFRNEGDNRILYMEDNSSILEFKKVEIGGSNVFEFATNELMDNPEFDEGNDSEGTIKNWSYLAGTSYSTFTWDNADQFKGNRCVNILKTDAESAYWNTTDNIDVEEPTDYFFPYYKFTCYVKTASVTAGSGSGAYLQIAWYSSTDTLVKTDSGTAVTGGQDYTLTTLTKPAPYNAAYAVARCVHDGNGGTAYFDVCSFRLVKWAGDTDNDFIALTKTYPHKSICVKYRMHNIPGITENLAIDMAARAALVNVSGGTTTGFNYKLGRLSVNQGSAATTRLKIVEHLSSTIDTALELLDKRGALRDEYDDMELTFNERISLGVEVPSYDNNDSVRYYPL